MKKYVLILALLCMQNVHGSVAVSLDTSEKESLSSVLLPLSSAPRVSLDGADLAEKSIDLALPPSPELAAIDDRYQVFTLPPIVVPDGGEDFKIDDFSIKYPVGRLSAPAHIQHSRVGDGHTLIELPVLQQSRGSFWPGGIVNIGNLGGTEVQYSMAQLKTADGLNCGYHALKNVIYMLSAFKCFRLGLSDKARELLFRMQDVSSFTQLLIPWLKKVIPYRYKNNRNAYRMYPKGNFPSGQDLEMLLGGEDYQDLIPEELDDLFLDVEDSLFYEGLHSRILILDSFYYLSVEDPEACTDKYLKFLEKIIRLPKGLYGFVVNDAACKGPQDGPRGSHWFGYVLWKDTQDRSTWLYTDSLFAPRHTVTKELIRICSQKPADLKRLKEARINKLLEVPFANIDKKIDLFLHIEDAFTYKFSIQKTCDFKNQVFAIEDFATYNASVEPSMSINAALVRSFNAILQKKLQAKLHAAYDKNAFRTNVLSKEKNYEFCFWKREKDASWNVTYRAAGSSTVYNNQYACFELLSGDGSFFEEIINYMEIPNDVFNQILQEPIGTVFWTDGIARRVLKCMRDILSYTLENKKMFTQQFNFLDYKERIFDKIKEDLDLLLPGVAMNEIQRIMADLYAIEG